MSWSYLAEMFTSDWSPETRRAVLGWTVYMFFIGFILYACGVGPGDRGFVIAEDLRVVQDDVDDVRQIMLDRIDNIDRKLDEIDRKLMSIDGRFGLVEISILEDKIEGAQRKRCGAEDAELRRQYTERLQRLMNQYNSIVERDYPLQQC